MAGFPLTSTDRAHGRVSTTMVSSYANAPCAHTDHSIPPVALSKSTRGEPDCPRNVRTGHESTVPALSTTFVRAVVPNVDHGNPIGHRNGADSAGTTPTRVDLPTAP